MTMFRRPARFIKNVFSVRFIKGLFSQLAQLVKKVFSNSKATPLVQFIRYFIASVGSFIVDYGLLWILTDFARVHYLVSGIIAFIAGLATNYVISAFWVFRGQRAVGRLAEILVFSAIGVFTMGLNEGILYLFTDIIGIHYLLSKMVSALTCVIVNFVLRKYILYNKADSRYESTE